MGKRGPAKKPTELKLLQGNPGRRPLNDREPKPDRTMPNCPTFLKPAAKSEWRRIARRLHEAKLLTYVDRSALAAYCQAYGLWVEAEDMTEKTGGEILTSDKNNFYHNPWASIARNARAEMMRYAGQFGMTPSARSSIQVPKGAADKPLSIAEAIAQAAAEAAQADADAMTAALFARVENKGE